MPTLLDRVATRTANPTVADIAARLGPIPLWRIRTDPPPGTATEMDVLRIQSQEDRLCELVDGILVEKTVGYEESLLAGWILTLLNNFVVPRRLGFVAGEAGMLKIGKGLVRIPDVSFISRRRVPGGKRPKGPIAGVVPDLAIEILSESNTPKEMRHKLREYFKSGVRLVWYVDRLARTVEVYTAVNHRIVVTGSQTLTGGDVLPGFKVKLKDLFATEDE
jgi:Uma2 family endonuclease